MSNSDLNFLGHVEPLRGWRLPLRAGRSPRERVFISAGGRGHPMSNADLNILGQMEPVRGWRLPLRAGRSPRE
jgi:hypothetical protein